MTAGEESFALLIDQFTHQLHPAQYKSAVVEALYAFTQFCLNHPQVQFKNPIVFDEVLERAAKNFALETLKDRVPSSTRIQELFFQQSPHVLNLYITLTYASMARPERLETAV